MKFNRLAFFFSIIIAIIIQNFLAYKLTNKIKNKNLNRSKNKNKNKSHNKNRNKDAELPMRNYEEIKSLGNPNYFLSEFDPINQGLNNNENHFFDLHYDQLLDNFSTEDDYRVVSPPYFTDDNDDE